VFRPSHADYTYHAKYGVRDHRGGGRSSARETVCRIVAGAIAKLLLKHSGVSIQAYVTAVGEINIGKPYFELDLSETENNIVRCPDKEIAEQMIVLIERTKKEGDTLGGIVSCVIKGTPAGLGEPVFDKLNADLGKAMLSINAVKGFELGAGFSSVSHTGSELNDEFFKHENTILSKSNNSGGIQGGISNGQDIYFNIAFKPVATIMKDQQSVNEKGEEVTVKGKGRHDPCVVPRAVPIVESMAALVMADHLLRARSSKL
jgi:chorismate synthase